MPRCAMIKLDLHAQRVEEALEQVERFLDQATVLGEYQVIVIHGHGTGKLKIAVRDYLANSPYVDSFHAGNPWEGGDGVTVVTLPGRA